MILSAQQSDAKCLMLLSLMLNAVRRCVHWLNAEKLSFPLTLSISVGEWKVCTLGRARTLDFRMMIGGTL